MLGAVSLLTVAPFVSSARVVDLDPEAIGLTEADYYTLKDSHCYFSEADAPSDAVKSYHSGMFCDPLLAQLAGQIIFRAQHGGEMYRVNDADGDDSLIRYLPDGFYKAKNTLYWVANGERVRLPKGDAYRRVMLVAQRSRGMITYIKTTSMNTERQAALRGRIVLIVDDNGRLAYVPDTIYGSDWRDLSAKNEAEWEEIIGDELIHVSPHLIKKLPVNNDWK